MGFGDVEQLLQGCLELCRVLVVLVVFYEGLRGYRSYAGRFKDLKLKVLRACSQYVEVPPGGTGGERAPRILLIEPKPAHVYETL